MTIEYRPWGPFHWVMARLADGEWDLVSVIGTEDRCAAVPRNVAGQSPRSALFLRIEDPEPEDESAYALRLDQIEASINAVCLYPSATERVPLLASIDRISECAERIARESGGRVVIDLTAMPKYWFFPLLRFLLRDERVRDLVATYASATEYAPAISSNPQPLAELPTFESDSSAEAHELIVGIGFAPLGLKDLYKPSIRRIRYLFPFPPGPPNVDRNWEFLKEMHNQTDFRDPKEGKHYNPKRDRWHVHMYDCPANFDALCRFSDQGRTSVLLAPFGPKTVSMAMCLFALAVERAGLGHVSAYYTQPKRYALDYSSGIGQRDGRDDIRAYCLKLGGRFLYGLPGS